MLCRNVSEAFWEQIPSERDINSNIAAVVHWSLLWIAPYIGSGVSIVLLLGLLHKLWDIYVTNIGNVGKHAKLPPGTSGLPFFGETIPFVVDGRKYFRSRLQKHGMVFRSYLLTSPTIVVCGAQNVRKILNGEGDIVTINLPPTCETLFGTASIAGSTGMKHYMRHLSVRRAFNHCNLTLFTPRMTEIMHSCIKNWQTHESVYAVEECKKMVFELGAEIILGFKFGCKDSSQLVKEFEVFSDNFFSMPIDLRGTGFHKAKQARRRFLDILATNVNLESNCMLRLLRQELHEKNENQEDANGMVLEILFAMTATTASVMSALLNTLASHEDVIRSVEDEIKTLVCQENLASYRDLSFQQMASSMPYVNGVLKEVLRLNPPIAGGFRKALKTFEIDGYHVPAGWGVLYCVTDTHEHASDFEPNFNPNRWIKHDLKNTLPNDKDCSVLNTSNSDTGISPVMQSFRNRHEMQQDLTETEVVNQRVLTKKAKRYDYIPFSAGSRVCPGKEFAKHFIRIFIIQICMTSKWSLLNPGAPIKTAPIPFAGDGLPICVKPRVSY